MSLVLTIMSPAEYQYFQIKKSLFIRINYPFKRGGNLVLKNTGTPRVPG